MCSVTRKMEKDQKIDPPDLDPELKELKETVFGMQKVKHFYRLSQQFMRKHHNDIHHHTHDLH